MEKKHCTHGVMIKNNIEAENSSGLNSSFFIVIIQAVLLALIIRSFLFQPFSIPSGSMKPTLLIGDYLFVSKYSYGYSRYSFPLSLNLFSGRIWFSQPERGDVVVFKLPSDNKTDYIKRLIGLPGDRVQMVDGVLYINGREVGKDYVDSFIDQDRKGYRKSIDRYRETLPNGVSYFVLDALPDGDLDNTDEYTVPPGHYFVMGDNRDNSIDSRVAVSWSGGVGFIPDENLVGRAEILFFSFDRNDSAWKFWRWPLSIRWKRLLQLID